MKRLAAALVAVPALALAQLASASGPQPYHAATSAPTGLHAFLLRPDESPQKYYPRTPAFAWNPVTARGGMVL